LNSAALTQLFQEDLYRFGSPVIVVLPKAWHEYTSEEQLLLKNILTSVKVDINAVQLIVRSSVDMNSLRVYAPAKALIFGLQTPDAIEKYQNLPAQGFTVIWADDLAALDDQKKKNLWVALRQMFGV
jgi:hypothetical protein